jgi:hypothetical protein
MDKPITNGGCGKGCLNLFFWVIVIGLLIEAWQASGGAGRALELLGLAVVGVAGLVVWGYRNQHKA